MAHRVTDPHPGHIPELPRPEDPLPDYSTPPEGYTAGQVLNMLVAHPKVGPMMPPLNSGTFTPLAELYKILQRADLLEANADGNYVLSKTGIAYIRARLSPTKHGQGGIGQ